MVLLGMVKAVVVGMVWGIVVDLLVLVVGVAAFVRVASWWFCRVWRR